MFFHGIKIEFLIKQFPFLDPDAHVSSKKGLQLKDRLHLIQRFGLEPVHLLESSASYPIKRCLKECFSFGDIVLAFQRLPEPIIQLSQHEIGVPYLDIRQCCFVFIKKKEYRSFFLGMGFKQPILVVKD